MSESEVQTSGQVSTPSSSFEWTLTEASNENLNDIPYLCSSFQSEPFPSLSLEIPNHVLGHTLSEHSSQPRQRITPDQRVTNHVLSTPVHEPESALNFVPPIASTSDQDFFQNFGNPSSCIGYVDHSPNNYSIKNESSMLLNLDSSFPGGFNGTSFNERLDLVCNPNNLTAGLNNQVNETNLTDPNNRPSSFCLPGDTGFISNDPTGFGNHLGDWNYPADPCTFEKSYNKYLWDLSSRDQAIHHENFTENSTNQPAATSNEGCNSNNSSFSSCCSSEGSNNLVIDVPEDLHDSVENCEAFPSEWSDIGGAAVLHRSLPEGSKELLSYMKIPDEAKKRKFLTVREMLTIKKKLTKACNQFQRDRDSITASSVLAYSEDSTDDYSLDPDQPESTLDLLPDQLDPLEPPPKKMRVTRVRQKKNKRKPPPPHPDLSDEELSTPNSVDSPNTPLSVPPPMASGGEASTDSTPAKSKMDDAAFTVPLPSCTTPTTPTTGTPTAGSLSPRSRQVFDSVYPSPQQAVPVSRTSHPDSYSRPRHFEFRLLQIGNYQFVSSGCDSNERLSRLKVIFTTQKFVYEYELPPRIPYSNEGQVLITRMISVEVPFSTVVGLDCSDTVFRLLVDTQPFVFVGYRTHYPDQSRCCVYERMAESDFTNGELATSPLHRLVLIRPEAANKLRYHLSNFNSRFAQLLRMPFPVANHIPHWPLRQQNIFTIPRDERLLPLPSPSSSSSSSSAPRTPTTLVSVPPTTPVTPVTPLLSDEVKNAKTQCSCRVSCRSKRCSCARQGKPCHLDKDCRCTNCDNALNTLCRWGIDVQWARTQPCLMDNVFSVESRVLQEHLQRCVVCPSCGLTMNLMQLLSHAMDCPKCFSSLNYSWCKGALTVSTTNKWQHCRICSTCLPASYVHCQKCDICVEPQPTSSSCPRCKQSTEPFRKIPAASSDGTVDHSQNPNNYQPHSREETSVITAHPNSAVNPQTSVAHSDAGFHW